MLTNQRNTQHLLFTAFGAALLLAPGGCTDDGDGDDETAVDTTGDGDTTGDSDTTGDGDGDPTGDGDGDPTGDGDGDPTGDGDGDDPLVDEDAIAAAMADYQNSFIKINAEPVVSGAHMGGGIMVNIWVAPENADQYKMLDPANPVAIGFPEGTLVIKEHLDGELNVAGGTVMYKGPAGYDADNGDWWYGMGDLQGTFAASGPGLANCLGCHSAQSASDYLHGVAPADQAP